jgi:hypothetical protein
MTKGQKFLTLTSIPVQSSLYLCNVQDMKAWKYIDLTWSFSHFLKIPNIPARVGFNSMILKDTSPKRNISYLTTINSSPTNLSVVLETIKQAQKVVEESSEEYMEVTYDLGTAKIALQIQSTEKPKFDDLFIHIGSFHVMMAYFKAVGKFIDNCGITNVSVNGSIYS